MGKPAAIVRLLRGAKSLTGGIQPPGNEEGSEPAAELAAIAKAEGATAAETSEPKAAAEKSLGGSAVDLEAGIAAIFAGAEGGAAPADNAGASASTGKPGNDTAGDFEAGIASIFAMIRSGTGPEVSREALPEETGATYVLLSKLDRLWQSA